jgi:hypothetical protein
MPSSWVASSTEVEDVAVEWWDVVDSWVESCVEEVADVVGCVDCWFSGWLAAVGWQKKLRNVPVVDGRAPCLFLHCE